MILRIYLVCVLTLTLVGKILSIHNFLKVYKLWEIILIIKFPTINCLMILKNIQISKGFILFRVKKINLMEFGRII